jgi:uncharacterized protein (TIGR01777 family)
MKILLTGGTGLIGRHLIARLQALHHDITVVTRSPEKARKVLGAGVDIWKGLAEQQNLDGFDAVINLAGEPIADKRWTEEQKQRLCSSRWNITEKLVELIRNSHTPPSVLISGSATGYYGDLGEVVVTEEEPPHNEFTHKLCAQWERIACAAQSDRTRVCLLRTGVVLAPNGGILGKMLPPLSWDSVDRLATAVSIWRGSISTIWSTAFSGCWITICADRLIWSRHIRCVMNSLLTLWGTPCIARRYCAYLPR